MKRLFDILFSLAALAIFSPVFIIAGILIKLDSVGKIFFAQKRVGRSSKEFSLFKFRTMKEGSEKSGLLTIGESDNRITRIGLYLRKYKLDELPQFINVLKGDMSIVGPRPEVKKYVDMYTEEQKRVLSAKPGITDIASLQFSEESEMLAKYPNAEEAYVKEIMPAKLSLSLKYLQERSIPADAVIIAKTVGKIFFPLSSRQHLENTLLALLVFSLPLYEKASAWLAVLVVVYRLFDRKVISDIKHASRNILAVLFLAYYLAHLAGTFYSSNLSYAFFDLQIKLPFLFFPLLLAAPLARPAVFLSLKKYFITGCSVASLLCLVTAGISFSISHDPFDFFYTTYSRFIHVTYFSMYLNLCVLFLIDDLINAEMTHRGRTVFKLSLLVFLFVNIILLSARTAMFTCFITAVSYSVLISVHRRILRHTYKVIVLLVVMFASAGVYSNKIYNRFVQVAEILQQGGPEKAADKLQTAESYNSVSIRVELWKDSWELIRKNIWFGAGTGDIKDVLKEKFTEEKFYYGAKKNFNPHNQFLHTAVTLGLTGLLILVLFLITPAAQALKHKNYLFIFFCAIVFLNCITESVLEVQKGVLFFCTFSILLFNSQHKKTVTDTTKLRQ